MEKRCFRCGVVKGEGQFYKRHSGTIISPCKPCRNIQTRQWQKDNPGSLKVANRKWRLKNLAHKNKAAKEYAKKHPDRVNAQNAKRRATRKSAIAGWANHFFMREAYHLAQLRTKMLGFPWHVDHIVPLKSPIVCGLHCEANLQVIPGKANRSKSNLHWPDMP